MNTLAIEIKQHLRDVADYPKAGIIFKDLSPILKNARLCRKMLKSMVQYFDNQNIDVIAGIESRGFWFGVLLAQELQIPFVPIRKKGKLPFDTFSQSYHLEYGSATLEMHTDALVSGNRVLIHDDLLATGGSAEACAQLITQGGGIVAGFSFLITLDFLNGIDKLSPISSNIHTLVNFE